MKRSRLTVCISLMLCGALLLSGTLLILHSGHGCEETSCVLCPILEGFMKMLLGLIAVVMIRGVLCGIRMSRALEPPENQLDPEWTLVQRKVKLLN